MNTLIHNSFQGTKIVGWDESVLWWHGQTRVQPHDAVRETSGKNCGTKQCLWNYFLTLNFRLSSTGFYKFTQDRVWVLKFRLEFFFSTSRNLQTQHPPQVLEQHGQLISFCCAIQKKKSVSLWVMSLMQLLRPRDMQPSVYNFLI